MNWHELILIFAQLIHSNPNNFWPLDLESYGIGREPLIAVDRNQTILLSQRASTQILFFNARGEYQFTHGSFGFGSGKYRHIDSIQYLPAMNLFAIHDKHAKAITIIDSQGIIRNYFTNLPAEVSSISFPLPGMALYLKVDRSTPHQNCEIRVFDFERELETTIFKLTNDHHQSRSTSSTNQNNEPWCAGLFFTHVREGIVVRLPNSSHLQLLSYSDGRELAFVELPKIFQSIDLISSDDSEHIWLVHNARNLYFYLVYDINFKLIGAGTFEYLPLAFQSAAAYLLRQNNENLFEIQKERLSFD